MLLLGYRSAEILGLGSNLPLVGLKKLNERNTITPTAESMTLAMERVLASRYFTNSARLSQFLRYVVEEEIAGRGAAIKGKTIAVAVYEKELDAAGNAQNLVRVEAQRLRRALDDYYATDGAAETLRLVMKPGGYRPSFEVAQSAADTNDMSLASTVSPSSPAETWDQGFWTPRRAALLAGISTCCLLATVAYTVVSKDAATPPDGLRTSDADQLAALRERSLVSVQALNLAQQARGTFFPLFDTRRQMIALDTFRHAAELDPSLAAGHAGIAQVTALLALLAPDTDAQAALLAEANASSLRALDIDPTDAWANASRAWVLAVTDKPDEALARARIAMRLAPEDGHVLDVAALTAFLAGDAQLAVEASDPTIPRTGDGRFGANNIWGVSQLVLGNYTETVQAFETSAQRGLPVSAPTLMLLATAYNQLGDTSSARRAMGEMIATWPEFPAGQATARFFKHHPEARGKVEAALLLRAPKTQ